MLLACMHILTPLFTTSKVLISYGDTELRHQELQMPCASSLLYGGKLRRKKISIRFIASNILLVMTFIREMFYVLQVHPHTEKLT